MVAAPIALSSEHRTPAKAARCPAKRRSFAALSLPVNPASAPRRQPGRGPDDLERLRAHLHPGAHRLPATLRHRRLKQRRLRLDLRRTRRLLTALDDVDEVTAVTWSASCESNEEEH